MLGQAGLTLPPLTDRARDGINAIIKDFGWAANPSDVTGFARSDAFPQIMDFMIEEPEVGTLVVASAGMGNQVEQVVSLRDRSEKNVAFFWTVSRAEKGALDKLKSANVPIFYTPDKLARALRNLLDYHEWRDRRLASGFAKAPVPSPEQEGARARLRGFARAALSESESKAVIGAWGVPVTKEVLAVSADAAVAAAGQLGYPVALKVDSPDILHKTEAGVVRLALRDAGAVRTAYGEVMTAAQRHAPGAAISGALVQEMVTGGVEVIVGIKHDTQIGPMLVFGSGGVMVEVYNDAAMRRCPVSRPEALEMISEVKGARLLRGFRGKPPADIDALADTLVRVSQLAVHLEGELAELDINPLMVLPAGEGVKAVDALVVLKR
jgi:acetyltransferase